MSSSSHMLKGLSKLCPGDHDHQQLVGGRAAAAAFYPVPLLIEILRGIRDTTDSEAQRNIEKEEQSSHIGTVLADRVIPESNPACVAGVISKEEIEAQNNKAHSSIPVKRNPKEQVSINFNDCHFKGKYLDEYTREELPRHLVKAAIIEELSYFNDNVWVLADYSEAKADPEAKIVRSRLGYL